jgi:hypothetical protein
MSNNDTRIDTQMSNLYINLTHLPTVGKWVSWVGKWVGRRFWGTKKFLGVRMLISNNKFGN